MTINDVRSSYDAFSVQTAPTTNYGDQRLLSINGAAGNLRSGYLFFGGLPPLGSTLFSATLRLYLRVSASSSWTGTGVNISAQRITKAWKESTLTYATVPTTTATNSASASVTNGVDRQAVDLDVTLMMQDVMAGAAWYGFRVFTTNTTNLVRGIFSSEATDPDLRPELILDWSRAPTSPVDLSPAGGNSVSVAKPVFTWTFKDREGDGQQAYRVLISNASTQSGGVLTTPAFDSGMVSSPLAQFDSSPSTWAGLTAGQVRYWQVQAQDANGLTSPWSQIQSFTRAAKGTLTVTSPVNGGTVSDTSPPITTTLSTAQSAITYTLYEDDGTGKYVRKWDKPKFAAPATAAAAFTFTMPDGQITRTGRNYQLIIRAYDTVTRDGTPGDPPYVQTTVTFKFSKSGTPPGITAMEAWAPTDGSPGVNIGAQMASGQALPDYLALAVDGRRVYRRIDPVTVLDTTGAWDRSNMAPSLDSSAASGIWSSTNTGLYTVAADTATKESGLQSVRSTRVAATLNTTLAVVNLSPTSSTHANRIPVTPGQVYSASMRGRSSVAGQQRVSLIFYSSTGSVISTANGALANIAAATWTTFTVQNVTAPVNAAYLSVLATANSTATLVGGEQAWFDTDMVNTGTTVATQHNGNSFFFTYYGASPLEPHVYEVEAVIGSGSLFQNSLTNPTATVTTMPAGIWLVDDTGGPFNTPPRMIRLLGNDNPDFKVGQSGTTFNPIGRKDPVRIVDSIRGLEGTISGTIRSDDPLGSTFIDDLKWAAGEEQIGWVWRCIAGSEAFPCIISDEVGMGVSRRPGVAEYNVSIPVSQVGEFFS